jgi:hypothetical protein
VGITLVALLACASLSACDKSKSKDGEPAASALPPIEPVTAGALAKVTPASLEAAAKKAGYSMKEARKTKTEMPGVALNRLSVERDGKPGFADFYDFSKVEEGDGKPVARVGAKRAIYVRVEKFDDESPESSAKVLAALLSKKQIDELTIADVKSTLEGAGWTLEGSSDQPDPNVPGVRSGDFTGEKKEDSLDVVVIDYADAAAGKTTTSAINDAHRVLLVDAKDKDASKKLASELAR